MRKNHQAFSICVLFVSGAVVSAQATPRIIVEKGIEAQGGEVKVAKLRTMRIKVEGTTDLVPASPTCH